MSTLLRKSRSTWPWFILFVSTGILSAITCGADEFNIINSSEDALRRKFLEEVSAMEQRLAGIELLSRSSITMTSQRRGKAENRSEMIVETASSGVHKLRKEIHDSGKGYSVSSKNTQYAFAVMNADGVSHLEYLTQLGGAALNDQRVNGEFDENGIGEHQPLAGFGFDLPLFKLIKMKGFEVTRISLLNLNDKQLVRVEFEYPESLLPEIKISQCYVICDPSRSWVAIEKGSTRFFSGSKATDVIVFTHEFDKSQSGLPLATRTTKLLKRKDASYESETVFENIVLDSPPDKEMFYLSYYGLPEPNFGAKRYGFWFGCISLGVAFLGVAWFLKRRSQLV